MLLLMNLEENICLSIFMKSVDGLQGSRKEQRVEPYFAEARFSWFFFFKSYLQKIRT